MELVQLIYVSQQAIGFNPDSLIQLARRSAERNQERDLSGVLLYCSGTFMQLLEGDSAIVQGAYQTISKDPRHSDVQQLLLKNVDKRMCPTWSMGLMNVDTDLRLNRERLERLVRDVREHTDTRAYGVEARILLQDFKLQVETSFPKPRRAK